jgi:hypothetical protein
VSHWRKVSSQSQEQLASARTTWLFAFFMRKKNRNRQCGKDFRDINVTNANVHLCSRPRSSFTHLHILPKFHLSSNFVHPFCWSPERSSG